VERRRGMPNGGLGIIFYELPPPFQKKKINVGQFIAYLCKYNHGNIS
jgi:hypothetical protein